MWIWSERCLTGGGMWWDDAAPWLECVGSSVKQEKDDEEAATALHCECGFSRQVSEEREGWQSWWVDGEEQGWKPALGGRDETEEDRVRGEGEIYGCSSFFFSDIRFFLAASIS